MDQRKPYQCQSAVLAVNAQNYHVFYLERQALLTALAFDSRKFIVGYLGRWKLFTVLGALSFSHCLGS